jgi:hypothetical protein
MNTFGEYVSVAFSVVHEDDAGAVGVGVGVAVADADSPDRAVVDEAGECPHAVAERTTAAVTATPATRRREIHERGGATITSAILLLTGVRD